MKISLTLKEIEVRLELLVEASNLVEDICPVSEFRADINKFIAKTRETHRQIVLT